ncbi:hydrolase [Roridomyces roridus]|uniref:Hydrolase n=1 Tax=Roridomyces roridus TaxID=1738132 RepID=A0AAD7BHU0_9AGAR|nr:hydrolase [Roridomyces roridus]
MANNRSNEFIPESLFRLAHPAVSPASPIVDTHTHLALTFESYRRKYPNGEYKTVYDFVQALYVPAGVQEIVDVWCEAPVRPLWREFADSALTEEKRRDLWGGMGYWFVMGVHPHQAKDYTDAIEADIIEAMAHPRCVGWGEMGLDYHYDTSPRPVQREVFIRQLRCAVRLKKPLTIHSREADADTECILKAEVPKDHKIHIHCFTNAPAFAQRLLDWFPNLYIGITGVITYGSNVDTSTTVRNMFLPSSPSPPRLRIVLETDAPYMVPNPVYNLPAFAKPEVKGQKLPLCHSGMLPWTAGFIANLLPKPQAAARSGAASGADAGGAEMWDAARVLSVARENARAMYGV